MPCDPLAFAAALHNDIILEADTEKCTVEVENPDTKGQTTFAAPGTACQDHGTSHNVGVVRKVRKVDVNRFAELLLACTD